MKILYVGHLDETGYGHMATNSILALDSVGVELACRSLTPKSRRLDARIEELSTKKLKGYDAVIQNSLPHNFHFNGKIPLSVGYYCTETDRFDGMTWPENINTLDTAWVCGRASEGASELSGVKVPIKIIPIACDVSRYQKRYEPLLIRSRLADSFIFYYIGEMNKRKDLASLIKAFHMEFDPGEPVELVIKTTNTSKTSDENFQAEIEKEISSLKTEMKLYRFPEFYKKEIILVGRYSDQEILRLHASCDCFVTASHGEAWCIPAFDAMAMGKTPIVPMHTGFREYMNHNGEFNSPYGYSCNYTTEPVVGMKGNTFSGLYTSRENWHTVSISDMMASMREAYEDKDLRKKKAALCLERSYDFSYEKVGRKIIECLN